MRLLAVSLAFAAAPFGQKMYGQKKFSWADYCFKNGSSIVCKDHDFATHPSPPVASSPATRPSPNVVSRPFSAVPRGAAPEMTMVSAIDWRFADPFADAVVGLNFNGLAASPLARDLVKQIGGKQGLSDADVQKIFDGLSDVEQMAISVRNQHVAVMIAGNVANSMSFPPDPDLKVVPLSSNTLLLGHIDAVDQARWRISMKGPVTDQMRWFEARQSSSEFWANGSAAFMGQAAIPGFQRFSMAVSLRDRLTSDLAFEFNGPPSPAILRQAPTTFGTVSLEGNTLHARASLEAEQARQKFADIQSSPLGPLLAKLVEGVKYLPARDTSVPKRTKPMIYGLDDGPREVQ